MQATQQQSFPITESRVISAATRPLEKSKPKTLIVLGVTLAGGMILSFGVAMFRELSDNVFRTSNQVETLLGANCLAMLPILKATAIKASLPDERTRSALARQRVIARTDKLFWCVVDQPFSRFTEAIRSLKVAADLNGVLKENKVIAVTSSLPNEGKTTVATNLAQLIAHAGGRVVLVDLDLRNPSLTRGLTPDSKGLIDVIAGKAALSDVIWTDQSTNLSFLPSGATPKMLHTNEILSSSIMKKLFESLRSAYDYVIVDLPPLAPVVDVRATTNLIDTYVYVVEWGRTKIDLVEHSLSAAAGIHERLLGVVLNKADTNILGRYEGYYGTYYQNKYYARYGYTD